MHLNKYLSPLTIALVLAANSLSLHAADTAEVACRSTAECAAQTEKIGATVDRSARDGKHLRDDQFAWINRINKASIVMLSEEGIVSQQQGQEIAGGVQYVLDQAGRANGKRPSDLLQIERIMIDRIG